MKYVCLSIGGFYLRDARAEFHMLQVADVRGHGPGDTTILRRTELGDGLVSLALVRDGAFLRGRADGFVEWGAEGPESRWTEVWWPNDQISLRSSSGRFLCAERGGGDRLVADRPEAAAWERFYYEVPPPELLPKEPPASRSNTLGKRRRRNPVAGPVDEADLNRTVINTLEP